MNDFIITATRSMREYALTLVEYLVKDPRFSQYAETINGVELLNTDRFANGEMEVTVLKPVRGKHVVLFTGCCRNDSGIEVEVSKIELYEKEKYRVLLKNGECLKAGSNGYKALKAAVNL